MSSAEGPLIGCAVLPPLLTAEDIVRQAAQVAHAVPGEPGQKASRGTGRGNRGGGAGKGQLTRRRFTVVNAFVDSSLAKLRRNDIAVWVVLWRDTKDGIARTGQTDIARRAGISDRTVRRAIGRLRRYGLLVLVYRGGLGRGTSAYRVEPHRTDGGQVAVRKQ